jgi:hypothetical protein
LRPFLIQQVKRKVGTRYQLGIARSDRQAPGNLEKKQQIANGFTVLNGPSLDMFRLGHVSGSRTGAGAAWIAKSYIGQLTPVRSLDHHVRRSPPACSP